MTYEENLKATLADVLSAVIPDSEAAADALVKKYGTLDRIFATSLSVVSDIETLGHAGGSYLELVAELISRSETDAFKFGIKHPDEEIDAYFCALLAPYSVEVVYIMSLDKSRRALGVDLISRGVVNASELLPRKVVERAISRGAAYVILAHNHPHGVAKMSDADMVSTALIDRALCASGIKLVRHVVTAGNTSLPFNLEECCEIKTI